VNQTSRPTALISVSDKRGLPEFGRRLIDHGWHLLSTGGTAAALREAGLAVTDIAEHTGFPEIMDGRVKTLHPTVHAGILARRGTDQPVLSEHGIDPIDLVVVNLYPFAETVARSDCTVEDAIEQIDVGGPAMIRAAAKNHADVCVVCDPDDYATIGEMLPRQPDPAMRRRLAAKAFQHTAAYDAQIGRYLARAEDAEAMPQGVELELERAAVLRYGENPHQAAAVYRSRGQPACGLAGTIPRQGKPLSYNNLLDADTAWRAVHQLGDRPGCVIVKHTNPCGAALGDALEAAWQRALACDPTSAFGGIVAFNRTVDRDLASALIKRFLEVILAPEVTPEALEVLAAKPNLRVLVPTTAPDHALELKAIDGGWLVQQPDHWNSERGDWSIVTDARPDSSTLSDLAFAWSVVAVVRSNAIVYARDQATVGIGAGQMSRVDSARIGVLKAEDAGLSLSGAVMASDAFFPFADSIEAAAARGIRAVIQPGGSMRDEEVIDACNRHGIAMVLTGQRHFRH
jgi:phosphoribosylaminoimidazolecarboxamide formyltransferase/IMP cyclohydrolase